MTPRHRSAVVARACVRASRLISRRRAGAACASLIAALASSAVYAQTSANDDTPRAGSPRIAKSSRPPPVQVVAENAYREGAALLHAGQLHEALAKFESVLQWQPLHVGARQALVGVLLALGEPGRAEQVLQGSLDLDPAQPGFAMALAHLRERRGDLEGALQALLRTAQTSPPQPPYLAMIGAILQRQRRHEEAVERFRGAVSAVPENGVWWVGLAVSLDELGRSEESRDAFLRAQASESLNADVRRFVDQRLRASR